MSANMIAHVEAYAPEIRLAYNRCRAMQRRHDPTFYVATRRLPAAVRPAVHALYGFVRGADEIVDGAQAYGTSEERKRRLDAWEATLFVGVQQGRSDHPVIAALVDAGARHDLPLDELHVYMDSMRVDCDPAVQMSSRSELDRYMNGSAASVGRIMAPLLGVPGDQAERVAALGVAFQLTNFLRDVREDYAMGRVYLPGVPEDALSAPSASDEVRERVAEEVGRARLLFDDSATITDEVDTRVRPGMRLAVAVYSRVLDRIERVGFDVLGARTTLRPWEMAGAIAGAWR